MGDTCHVVEGMTVDKFMADYRLSRIDILKVDIEGAEREVFNDTSAWIGRVNSVIIELHERMKVGCNPQLLSWLGGLRSRVAAG